MVRWSPSKIQCAGLVREMRYFMSDVPSLRSFIPTYPFLWWGLSESSKWLCGCLAGLSSLSLGINLVFIGVNLWNIRHHLFRRVFWKAACNLSVSSRLQSLCSTATAGGATCDAGSAFPSEPLCSCRQTARSVTARRREFITWEVILQIRWLLAGLLLMALFSQSHF